MSATDSEASNSIQGIKYLREFMVYPLHLRQLLKVDRARNGRPMMFDRHKKRNCGRNSYFPQCFHVSISSGSDVKNGQALEFEYHAGVYQQVVPDWIPDYQVVHANSGGQQGGKHEIHTAAHFHG